MTNEPSKLRKQQPTQARAGKAVGQRRRSKKRVPVAPPGRRHYTALLDFDGLLCDMDPFVYELEDRAAPGRWKRFFGHTSEAASVAAGVELVAALQRLGWRYSVSSTRPSWAKADVRHWVRVTMPVSPEWIYISHPGGLEAVEVKRRHYVEAMVSHAPVCGIYVDDEMAVVDDLIELDVPAMHIEELAGLSDGDLHQVLQYSVKGADQRRKEMRAAARRNGERRTERDETLGRVFVALAEARRREQESGSDVPLGGGSSAVVERELADGALRAPLDGAGRGAESGGGEVQLGDA